MLLDGASEQLASGGRVLMVYLALNRTTSSIQLKLFPWVGLSEVKTRACQPCQLQWGQMAYSTDCHQLRGACHSRAWALLFGMRSQSAKRALVAIFSCVYFQPRASIPLPFNQTPIDHLSIESCLGQLIPPTPRPSTLCAVTPENYRQNELHSATGFVHPDPPQGQ